MYINTNEEILASNHGYISGQAIELYCRFIADKEGYDLVIIKESLARLNSNSNFSEGDEKEIQGIVYERDPKARKACIEYYGCKCIICGMDFEQVYGDLGKGFIEVHHIIPISERGGHYIVDPIKDLRPLCSNCHSMIHRLKHVLTIEELKKIIVSPTDNKHL
jgi:predicted HNH restriction endonuclease